MESVTAYLKADKEGRRSLSLDRTSEDSKLASSEGVPKELKRQAIWVQSEGPSVEAELIDGTWRLSAGVLHSEFAASPEQALVLFERALAERDARLLLALLLDSERAHWSQPYIDAFWADDVRVKRLLTLSRKLVNQAPRALMKGTLAVGEEDGLLVLERDKSGWKIRDIRPHGFFLNRPSSLPDREQP